MATPESYLHHDDTYDGQEVEILFMRKRVAGKTMVTEIEVSFLSDHHVIYCSKLDGANPSYRFGLWNTLEDVHKKAKEFEEKYGYELTWNPNWQPHLQEFKKEVSF